MFDSSWWLGSGTARVIRQQGQVVVENAQVDERLDGAEIVADAVEVGLLEQQPMVDHVGRASTCNAIGP